MRPQVQTFFMNLQQLEYIVAVDTYRHFARAAEACRVTQPTLSMMIHKLEESLEIKIFDRSRQPVVPTEMGERVISQARIVLQEVGRMQEMIEESKNKVTGELKVGILPTIAPYLLPLFLQHFQQKYPAIRLKLAEHMTASLIEKLQRGELDAGILVLPEQNAHLFEYPLYQEPFVVYTPRTFEKDYLLAEDIDVQELLLLEEGHCFRSQIMQFCELRKKHENPVEYTSGSLETLRYLADKQLGITILPALALEHFSADQMKNVKRFAVPQPTRQVSLVTHRDFVKKRMIQFLAMEIQASLPPSLENISGKTIPLHG